jgi:iron complex outermembrane receptor protein
MNLDHVFKQNRISVHEEEDDHGDGDDHGDDDEHDEHEHGETATAAYSLLNAYAAYDLNIGDSEGELFVRGYNLTDELARVHTSFLKSSAPLPGANVEIGLKFDF